MAAFFWSEKFVFKRRRVNGSLQEDKGGMAAFFGAKKFVFTRRRADGSLQEDKEVWRFQAAKNFVI